MPTEAAALKPWRPCVSPRRPAAIWRRRWNGIAAVLSARLQLQGRIRTLTGAGPPAGVDRWRIDAGSGAAY